MTLRSMALAGLFVVGIPSLGFAQLTTEKDVQSKLQRDGYTGVHDINFGAEAISAKATKDGKEWLLVIDSSGKVIQKRAE